MDKVKLGMIGCGVIGSRNLMDAMASDVVQVVAAADLRVERREWASSQGVPVVYEDGRDLIDQDPDVEAVVISFPAMGRTAMALRAFERGKHVLTEKPVAMNATEVKTMIARKGDLAAGCLSARNRMCESAKKATAVVASGVLGDLRTIHVRVHVAAGAPPEKMPPPWRQVFSMNAGGILTNWSCYDLDYVLGVAGWQFKPKAVLAQWWPCVPQFRDRVAPEADADSYFTALVRGEDGSVLTVERGEFMPAHAQAQWQVVGTQGSLSLHMTNADDRKIVHDDTTPDKGVESKVIWEGKDPAPSGNPLVIEDFAQAIREGRQPSTSLERVLSVAQIMDGIYASAASGQGVAIE